MDGHEHLDFLVIVKDEWLLENGYLTPTQKIKCPTIEGEHEQYARVWYVETKKGTWFGWVDKWKRENKHDM